MRINKWLAEHGDWSRREADRLIQAGKVKINSMRAELGTIVSDGDEITVSGKRIHSDAKKIYLMLHKPVGYITTTDQKKKDTVMDLIDIPERVFPVGRLDVASSGLLLLTNDGALSQKLMHPSFEQEKEYIVEVNRNVTDQELQKLSSGIKLRDGMTSPATTKRLSRKKFSITIHEGRNRQIRRMCEAIGLEVDSLQRIRIKSLDLGNLKPGSWRYLTPKELESLKN